jgi:F-type H+-transporting ATPase subunit c
MIGAAAFVHFISVALSTVFTAFGVSRGQGYAMQAAFDAINRQPAAERPITRTVLLALTFIETGAILGLVISFILFFKMPGTVPAALAELGIAFAIGIPGLAIGWASAKPAHEAFNAIARQPFLAAKIGNFMLLAQSLIQTPLIFGFIIALLIQAQIASIKTVGQACALIGCGLAIGLGSVGPALGGGHFTQSACKSIGLNKNAYQRLFTFTFISQAIIETPVIFALIVAFLLSAKASSPIESTLIGIAYIFFGLTIGLGTIGPGIASGKTAAAAAVQIAYKPQAYNLLSRSSMIAQGLIDTCAIYAFIVALWLIFSRLT